MTSIQRINPRKHEGAESETSHPIHFPTSSSHTRSRRALLPNDGHMCLRSCSWPSTSLNPVPSTMSPLRHHAVAASTPISPTLVEKALRLGQSLLVRFDNTLTISSQITISCNRSITTSTHTQCTQRRCHASHRCQGALLIQVRRMIKEWKDPSVLPHNRRAQSVTCGNREDVSHASEN